MLDANLHPDLYRLIKRPTTGERAALLVLVLTNMTLGSLGMFMLGKGGAFDLMGLACMGLATGALVGAVALVPVTRAWRADRLAKAIRLLERKDLCPNCSQSLGVQSSAEKCPMCHLSRTESLSAHLARTLRLIAPGLRPHFARTWARLAHEAGVAEAEQVMGDLRLPRRAFRISYLLASAVSIVLIVLVFGLMGVSDTASRAMAMIAVPLVVVSFLAAFLTSSPADPELVGPLRTDDEGHPVQS